MLYKGKDNAITGLIGALTKGQTTVVSYDIQSVWNPGMQFMIAMTWDSKNVALYLNGKKVSVKPIRIPVYDPGNDFFIGGPFGAPGEKDDLFTQVYALKIWKKALSENDIAGIYKKTGTGMTWLDTLHVRAEDNIAADDSGCVIIASSTLNLKNDIDKMLDEFELTWWEHNPLVDTEPYLEFRWPYPVKPAVLALLADGEFEYKIFVPHADGWKEILNTASKKNTPLQKNEKKADLLNFITKETDRIRIQFNPEKQFRIFEIYISGSRRVLYYPKNVSAPGILTVEDVQLSKNETIPGGEITVTAKISAEKNMLLPMSVICEVEEPMRESFFQDYTIARAAAVLDTYSATLVFTMKIPWYAPAGSFSADISAQNAAGKITIESGGEKSGKCTKLSALRITGAEKKYKSGNDFPDVVMSNIMGRATLTINGEITDPLIWTVSANGFSRYAEYGKAGGNIWQLQNLRQPPLGGFSSLDEDILASCLVFEQDILNLLRINPDAYIMLLPCSRPREGWYKKNPGQKVILADGSEDVGHSFSSKKWLQDVTYALRKTVEYMRSKPYASRIIAVAPYFGRGGDGWAWGIDANVSKKRELAVVGDYNPKEIEGFRTWLRNKYGNDEKKLREAYQNKTITFSTAGYSVKDLAGTEKMNFRDPAEARAAVDYWEFHSWTVINGILECGKAVKEASGGKLLYGSHYSYINNVLVNAAPGFAQQSGALGIDIYLDSPITDMAASGCSGDMKTMGNMFDYGHPQRSIEKRRKLSISETDLRTFLVRVPGTYSYYQHYSLWESIQVLKRDFAVALIQNSTLRYYDMSFKPESTRANGSLPWFDDPALLDIIGKSMKIYSGALKDPAKPCAEILVVIDNITGYYHDIYAATLYRSLLRGLREQLFRTGAPYDMVLQSDIIDRSVTGTYKLVIFLNAFRVTKDQKSAIAEMQRLGKTMLWFYTPGIIDENDQYNPRNISSVTGMDISLEIKEADLEVTLIKSGTPHPILTPFPSDPVQKTYGWPAETHLSQHVLYGSKMGPIPYVTDRSAEVLGVLTVNGEPGLAVKKTGNGYTVFCAVPFMSADLLRNIASFSGVHIYSTNGLLFDANSGYVTLHNGGSFQNAAVTLPKPAKKIIDVFSGIVYGKNTAVFTVPLKPYETCVLSVRQGG